MKTEYFLHVAEEISGSTANLNGAYLSRYDDGSETVLIKRIALPTAKGWASRKAIIEELDIMHTEGSQSFIISESCAMLLVAKYGDVITKQFIRPSAGPSAAHVIANFITKNGTDPYDRG